MLRKKIKAIHGELLKAESRRFPRSVCVCLYTRTLMHVHDCVCEGQRPVLSVVSQERSVLFVTQNKLDWPAQESQDTPPLPLPLWLPSQHQGCKHTSAFFTATILRVSLLVMFSEICFERTLSSVSKVLFKYSELQGDNKVFLYQLSIAGESVHCCANSVFHFMTERRLSGFDRAIFNVMSHRFFASAWSALRHTQPNLSPGEEQHEMLETWSAALETGYRTRWCATQTSKRVLVTGVLLCWSLCLEVQYHILRPVFVIGMFIGTRW